MRSAHFNGIRKKVLPPEQIKALNECFFEKNYTETKLVKEFKMSISVIGRNLATTRTEWENMKRRFQ